ncbi:TerD family protein [Streptomyces rubrolavendulae]|uniref:General stress protein 16U n=1 Tax=Streptomyces rubrolavendulae TaxID=285473 RepID=A0A1D8FYS4_9ACTN|nr:TerD family protein [Streptomyces rubrolavendulae]AOT58359.1 General stress protein 16U [Streptomyces rubrolavendulae]
MTAELVRGQNHPLPGTRLEIRVSAGVPVAAGATLCDAAGTVTAADRVAHPGAPSLPGVQVPRRAAAEHRLTVDLGAVPADVHRVAVHLALPEGAGGHDRFGAVAAPFVAVAEPDGTGIATYTLTGLTTESAVVAVELYRRQGAWKVRAVGQGYEGGLAALLRDQGVPGAAALAAAVRDAVAPGPDQAAPAPAPRSAQDAPGHRTAPAAASPAPGLPAPPAGAPAPRPPRTPAAPAAAPEPARPGVPAPPAAAHVPPPPSQAPSQAASSGGPIDYTHPRRRTAPPPPRLPSAPPAPPGTPAAPVAGDATGWSMEERLYNQVWGMFEDLARATAAYRSAVDFAESRMARELDSALSDPRSRLGTAGDAARAEARARCRELTDRAREALDRDLAQLTAESEVVEPALPPAFARWDNPVWHAYRVPTEPPMALRLGDLHLPERPQLRIPMLIRLPLERGLWVDAGRGGSEQALLMDEDRLRRLALDTAVAHAARLLAAHPPGGLTVQVIDPAGSGAAAFAPLTASGVLAGPPAAGPGGVEAVLERLVRRVDLVQMALRGGADDDALPPDLDTARQLLVVNDFPLGFDDRAVTRLRYLADEGPAVGVHLLMVADREDAAAYGPLLDPLWRSLLRVTPVPDDHLADPWVGHAWTYEPPRVPTGSQVLHQVLERVAQARRARGR